MHVGKRHTLNRVKYSHNFNLLELQTKFLMDVLMDQRQALPKTPAGMPCAPSLCVEQLPSLFGSEEIPEPANNILPLLFNRKMNISNDVGRSASGEALKAPQTFESTHPMNAR